ncbi:tripartite tricarboxylate transporter substrate binding protein [Advenella kashmirensis]
MIGNLSRVGLLRAAFAISAFLTPLTASLAQDGAPVRFVVPFTPGGGNDILARTLAPRLAEKLHRNVIVENKPGAGGNIGTAFVANAKPDGNTILIAGSQITTQPALGMKTSFDIQKDLAPVGMIAEVPMIFVVNPKMPYKTMEEFILYARNHPNEINYSSPGIGVPQHLAGELLAGLAKIDITHVPYQGTGPSVADVIGGQIQSTFGSMGSVLPQIQNGSLRALGVARSKRTSVLPDVPAFSEIKGGDMSKYNASLWFSVMAPAGTSQEKIDSLNAAINDALDSPDVQKKLSEQGFEISKSTPEELAKIINSDLALWQKVAEDNKLSTKQ